MVEFFQTVMGHRFYEGTMPDLVKAVEKQAKATNRLADAMEENNKLLRAALPKNKITTEELVQIMKDSTDEEGKS